MQKKIFISILLVSSVLFSCYNDTEEKLYGVSECNLTNVSYQLNVVPLVNSACSSCHSQNTATSNGAGIVLDKHNDLLMWVNNGQLVGSITHAAGASPMPKNASRLSDCNINIIKTWIAQGALNN